MDFGEWQRQLGDVFQKATEAHTQENIIETAEQIKGLKGEYKDLITKDFPYIVGKFLLAVSVGFAVSEKLALRWRDWMTDKFTGDWLGNKAFYRLQTVYRNTKNPDQRIQEDIDKFTSTTMLLTRSALKSFVSLGVFSSVLWGLSGDFNLSSIGGPDQELPGFMFWTALGYAGLSAATTHMIGKPLSAKENRQRLYEGGYRSALIRILENAENIALYNGEKAEKSILRDLFNPVVRNAKEIIQKKTQLATTRSLYNHVAFSLPYIVASPLCFAGAIGVGGLLQTAYAFNQVQNALSWFSYNYPLLAEEKATIDRLVEFSSAIEKSNKDTDIKEKYAPIEKQEKTAKEDKTTSGSFNRTANVPRSVIVSRSKGTEDITIKNLTLQLEDGNSILENVSMTLKPGDRIMLTGPSGVGKSCLLRAIGKNIWEYGEGLITLPEHKKILPIPQDDYLPQGSLRHIVCYPELPEKFADKEIRECLKKAGHEKLIPYLDDKEKDGTYWSQRLSGGEKQRLIFARIFLNKPDILLLDEVTSALDHKSGPKLYGDMLEQLPDEAIVISISHKDDIKSYHNIHAKLENKTIHITPIAPNRHNHPGHDLK